jgi:hypothetical protein
MRTPAAFAKPRHAPSLSRALTRMRPFTHLKPLHTFITALALLAGLASPSAQAQYSATPTSFSVTDAGASSLNIPIYTAPAGGGLDVKLALQYNSQSGNGVFGVGWNLSGVSSITRCPKTIAEEGERIGVKNDASDIFCLDGQKLRAIAGGYGAAGAEYRTAIDSYSQIISNGNYYGGPLGFTVKTKSGAILEFGGTDAAGALDASALEHPSKGVVRVWMLKNIKDRFNNQINFSYGKNTAAGEQLLRYVSYNNGYVEIQYAPRPTNDYILKYDDGVQLGSTNQLATKILINDYPLQANGTRPTRTFKEYRLAYTQSLTTQRSLMSSVQECGSDGACLPAVTMDYNSAGVVGFRPGEGVYLGHPNAAGSAPILVDDQGNGKPRITSAASAPGYNTFGAFSTAQSFQIGVSTYDIDSDGKTDYIYNISGRDKNYQAVYSTSQLLSSGGQGMTTISTGQTISCFADLDGDGKSEVVRISSDYSIGSSSTFGVFANGIRIGSGNGQLVSTAGLVYQPLGGYSCKTIDANGDGRAEIDIYIPTGKLSYSLPVGSSVAKIDNVFKVPDYQDYKGSTTGDFNGDGKTDEVHFAGGYPTNANWTGFYYHTGGAKADLALMNSYAPVELEAIASPAIFSSVINPSCTGDFNGDGRTDGATVDLSTVVFNGSTALFNFNIYVSQNLNFRKESAKLTTQNDQSVLTLICADFDGNGLTDVFYNGQYHYNTLPNAVDALKYAYNGLGQYYFIDYKSITEPDVYTKYSGEQLPRVDLQTPIQVVRYVTDTTGAGSVRTRYQYYGLKADLQRRGTLGFKTVQSINENTGITSSTDYHQTYPLIGLKERNQQWFNNARFAETNYSYLTRGIGGGALNALGAQVELNQITSKQWDINDNAYMGSSLDTINGIDIWGNPSSTDHQEFDASGTLTSQKVSEYTHTNDTARWLIGQVKSAKVTSYNNRALPSTVAGSTLSAAGAQEAASQTGEPPPPPPPTAAQKAAIVGAIVPLLLND